MQTATEIKPHEQRSRISLYWKVAIGIGKGIAIKGMIFAYSNYLEYQAYKFKMNFLRHEIIKNRS